MMPPPPRSTLFPYTTLFRSAPMQVAPEATDELYEAAAEKHLLIMPLIESRGDWTFRDELDRKSTRLNSSHEWISYAVFCLKKKRNTTNDFYTHLQTLA